MLKKNNNGSRYLFITYQIPLLLEQGIWEDVMRADAAVLGLVLRRRLKVAEETGKVAERGKVGVGEVSLPSLLLVLLLHPQHLRT